MLAFRPATDLPMLIRFFLLMLLTTCVLGCVTQTKVLNADLTQRQGVYVVGFSDEAEIRNQLEDQIVLDLGTNNVKAYASHLDFAEVKRSTRESVIASANTHAMLAILVVNQVSADASDSIIQDPKRVSPTHPDLRAFYDYNKKNSLPAPTDNALVLAEVNLFIIEGDQASLFWSGTTWSENADGKGSAISDVSDLVARQISAVRAKYITDDKNQIR